MKTTKGIEIGDNDIVISTTVKAFSVKAFCITNRLQKEYAFSVPAALYYAMNMLQKYGDMTGTIYYTEDAVDMINSQLIDTTYSTGYAPGEYDE